MGVFAALLSACFATTKDLVSKKLSFQIDGTTSTFASFAFALPFYVILLTVLLLLGYEEVNITPVFLFYVLLRSLTDSFAEAFKMHAFNHGDLSLVATFLSLSPLFLLVTSPLLTGDELRPGTALATLVLVAGSLLLVYKPGDRRWAEQKKGILLAVGAALFFSLNSCFDRLSVQKGPPAFSAFAMTLLSALFLTPFVVGRVKRLGLLWTERRWLLVRGFLEVPFMVLKLTALQTYQATEVVGYQRVSLLLSIVAGHFLFKEGDFWRRFAAGLLILFGLVLNAWL